MIVCFEGLDCCGKSTQAKMLAHYLEEHQRTVVVFERPEQELFGSLCRIPHRRPIHVKGDVAARLMFWAEYLEAIAGGLPDADVIILERHPRYSNYAYGSPMGTSSAMLLALDEVLAGYRPLPDVTLLLDVPADLAWRRTMGRYGLDQVGDLGFQYFCRVKSKYLEAVALFSEIQIVNGARRPEKVHKEIVGFIRQLMAGKTEQ